MSNDGEAPKGAQAPLWPDFDADAEQEQAAEPEPEDEPTLAERDAEPEREQEPAPDQATEALHIPEAEPEPARTTEAQRAKEPEAQRATGTQHDPEPEAEQAPATRHVPEPEAEQATRTQRVPEVEQATHPEPEAEQPTRTRHDPGPEAEQATRTHPEPEAERTTGTQHVPEPEAEQANGPQHVPEPVAERTTGTQHALESETERANGTQRAPGAEAEQLVGTRHAPESGPEQPAEIEQTTEALHVPEQEVEDEPAAERQGYTEQATVRSPLVARLAPENPPEKPREKSPADAAEEQAAAPVWPVRPPEREPRPPEREPDESAQPRPTPEMRSSPQPWERAQWRPQEKASAEQAPPRQRPAPQQWPTPRPRYEQDQPTGIIPVIRPDQETGYRGKARPDYEAGHRGQVQPDPPTEPSFAKNTADDTDGREQDRATPMRVLPSGETESAAVSQPRPRKRRRGVLIGAGAVLVVLVLAAGALVGVPGLAAKIGVPLPGAIRPTDPPAQPQAIQQLIHPLAQSTSEPSAQGVQQALASVTSSPGLGTLTGAVLDPRSGDTLWQHAPTQPLAPGSTLKLLTSAAALLSMDPGFRFDTKVVQGADPSTAVLVGGGDVTINSLPAGQESVYARSAHLSDLVAQVRKASGGRITKVQIDQSRYTGPSAASGWLPVDIQAGNYAPMVPAMLDGGRTDPTKAEGTPRNPNPGGALLGKFASGIGASAAGTGSAPAGAKVLGVIHSAPLPDLVANLLTESDNLLAEAVGRQLAIQNGLPASFSGAVSAVKKVLSANGFDVSGVTMADCSGLSTQDKIPAMATASVMRVAASNDPRAAKLGPLLDGLPIAGGTGTLAANNRFQAGSSLAGKGYVRAKTGSLDNVNTLSGLVQTKGGAVLVFTFMSNGSSGDVARPALDAIATTLRGCGCG